MVETSIDLACGYQRRYGCSEEFSDPVYDGFLQVARVNCTSRIGPIF